MTGALLACTGVAHAGDRIYWSNYKGETISAANLDGSGSGSDLSSTGATMNDPQGLVIDAERNRVYWVNSGGTTISFANLDGTGSGGDVNTTGATVYGARGLAIDPAHNHIYWANSGNNRHSISFANLDGSGGGDLYTSGPKLNRPVGLAIDPAANRIYWTNLPSNAATAAANTLSFANLDGSGGAGTIDTTGASPVNFPEGVAIDAAHNRIYWANAGSNTISAANLDGTGNGRDLNVTGATINGPLGVALDPAHNRVYWANGGFGTNTISSANLDGTGSGRDLSTTGATFNSPAFVVLLQAPVAAGAPAVTSSGALGSPLTCSRGTWAPDLLGSHLYDTGTLTYAWLLGSSEITGATAPTYTPAQPGDYSCRVTSTNPAGSAAQSSQALRVSAAEPQPAPVQALAPVQAQAPAPKIGALVAFPGVKQCASRRNFGIRLRVPRGSDVLKAVVTVNGKQVAVRSGDRLRSRVDLRNLPNGRFKVAIVLTLRDGRTVQGSRKYRTCTAKRGSGRPRL